MPNSKNLNPCKKKKAKGKAKDIDWAASEFFDPNRSIIQIEHSEECPVFKEKAIEFLAFLQDRIPERNFQLVRNLNGKQQPRPGAFEINFSQNARSSNHFLWSGIERGPPRREKFPEDYEAFVPEVKKILKKVYVDLMREADEEEDEEKYD